MPKDTRFQRYKEWVHNKAQRLRGGLVGLWTKSMAWGRRYGVTILQATRNGMWKTRDYLKRHPFLLGGIIVLALLIPFIWSLCQIPEWEVAGAQLTDEKRIELMDKIRGTIAQIWAGIVVLVGLGFTWRRIEIAREGQVTERFTRAIDQLGAADEHGNKRLELRLGGIYALERIARDSEKDHWPIMEVLTAYVREHARWKENTQPQQYQPQDSAALSSENATQQQEPQARPAPDTDIQAILTVIGRRTRRYGKGEDQRLDLRETDLRGADLSGAHLQGADLQEAHLQGANLTRAHLQKAKLIEAHLQGANLGGAHLQRAELINANLKGAFLISTHLEGADLIYAHLEGVNLISAHLQEAKLIEAHLQGANLDGTHLEGVNLSRTLGLTREQLAVAFTDENTLLPYYLLLPDYLTSSQATDEEDA